MYTRRHTSKVSQAPASSHPMLVLVLLILIAKFMLGVKPVQQCHAW